MSRKSGAANHIHRYKKVNLGENGKEFFVYKCVKPACSHYVPISLAEGKVCECNRCFNPMVITKDILVHSGKKPMTKPHCSDCVRRKKSNALDAIAAYLEGNKT